MISSLNMLRHYQSHQQSSVISFVRPGVKRMFGMKANITFKLSVASTPSNLWHASADEQHEE